MRIATILCLSLLIVSGFTLTMKSHMNAAQVKNIENLRNSNNSWSKIIMNLAELQMMTQGPLDELTEAIDNLLNDLADKVVANQDDFRTSTNIHTSTVSTLSNEITSANNDIANTSSNLNDILIPKKNSLVKSIDNEQNDQADSEKQLETSIQQRNQAHSDWTVRVQDHNEAIAAIGEALSVLNQLIVNGGQVSLVQMKSTKAALLKVQKRLGKNLDATLAKALVELASKEFANQDTVQKAVDLLKQINNNLSESLVAENNNEQNDQKNHEDHVTALSEHIAQVTASLQRNRSELENTLKAIKENQDFLAGREADLEKNTNALQAENNNYEKITASYKDVEQQLNSELQAGEQALGIIKSGDFASYLGDKLNNAAGSENAHFQA